MSANKFKVGVSLLVMSVWLCQSQAAFGEESATTTGIGFTYQNKIPKNQIKTGNFFDLLVEPGAEQVLVTDISNHEQREMTIKITINNSKTTETGLIEYGESSLKNTSAELYPLEKHLQGSTELVLKAGETKPVEFKLVAPKEEFAGVILGGVQLQEIQKKSEQTSSFSVENEYAYVFSVSLRQNQQELPFNFNDGESRYFSEEGKVLLTINNEAQKIVKELTLKTEVRNFASDELVAESTSVEMKMAPMSVLTYPIAVKELEPGNYVTRTSLLIEEQEWFFEQNFEVLASVAQKDLNYSEGRQKVKILGPVIMLIASVIIGTVILYIVLTKYADCKIKLDK